MDNFDEFWAKNSQAYIDYAKSVAKQDFNELSKKRLGKFIATINIDTDDDFYFANGTQFEVYGDSQKEILKNSIEFLQNLNITRGSQSKWQWLRDECVELIRQGQTSFNFGGNQTMDFDISENSPNVKVKLKI